MLCNYLLVSYYVVMNVSAGVHSAAVQWTVVSGSSLPVSMVVIGHDADEVQVTVDLEKFSLRSTIELFIAYMQNIWLKVKL